MGSFFELRPGLPLVLGRALSSDLPVLDPTVSRRHAELTIEPSSVQIKDLGSSNGTFVNGSRVTATTLRTGDRVVFGKILFELQDLSPMLIDDGTAETKRRAARAGTTVIKQVPVPDADLTLERALRASGVQQAVDETAVVLPQHERDRLRLRSSWRFRKRSPAPRRSRRSREDAPLHLPARGRGPASMLLLDEDNRLTERLTRVRDGSVMHAVPVALAQSALDRNRRSCPTTPSSSPVATRDECRVRATHRRRRRSCVFYVDSATSTRRVDDDDLDSSSPLRASGPWRSKTALAERSGMKP
jgi:adenylate cyclase